MSTEIKLSSTDLRGLLTSFWDEVLEIESTPRGLLFTMPASYPDGWQVVLELSQKTPKGFRLSDRGKTLTWLTGQGQNIETDFSGTMEKWGFRWKGMKENYPNLAPIMLYDRNTQVIDSYSRHIGESECELFCGYDETDRIHETLTALR